ncbi:MAG: SDR family NAD(P)-dependent oxidoreductase, partial [Pseudonocardiaceae bacterium]
MDLTNASAIVTGGAGGFGAATVRRLAQMGAKVVIADVSDERGEELAREVGAGSLYVTTDCMDEDAIATTVKAAAPGLFFTLSLSENMTAEQAQERWGSSVPNPKRLGDPDEYAILAAQIVENDFLNGTTIRLDRGTLAKIDRKVLSGLITIT